MTSRLKKASYTTIVALGLFAGAAGIAAAAGRSSTPTPAPPAVVTPAADNKAADSPEANDTADATEAPGDSGVNCENGIDTATGAQCDGGPAANQANDATEAPVAESNDATDANAPAANEAPGDSGVNCENGIDTATGAQCDGGPAANQANDPTEAGQPAEGNG